MPFEETPIPGLLVFTPKVFEDERGYFFEAFNQQLFEHQGIKTTFVQDNQSQSSYGVVRGFHYQLEPYAQAKLVRVLEGEVLDVVVDIRSGSPTFGESYSLVLTADNRKQLYIPRGFAHGFAVLSDIATFFYKCDNFYSKEHEAGIRFDDQELGVDWQLPEEQIILSEKDTHLPSFSEADMNFKF